MKLSVIVVGLLAMTAATSLSAQERPFAFYIEPVAYDPIGPIMYQRFGFEVSFFADPFADVSNQGLRSFVSREQLPGLGNNGNATFTSQTGQQARNGMTGFTRFTISAGDGSSSFGFSLLMNPTTGSVSVNDYSDLSGNLRIADRSYNLEGGFPRAIAMPAVPEPTSWAMMIGGFGVVGGALRYRRRGMKIAYAGA